MVYQSPEQDLIDRPPKRVRLCLSKKNFWMAIVMVLALQQDAG
jgi:hypothetical protein